MYLEIYTLGTARVVVKIGGKVKTDIVFNHRKAFGILFLLVNSSSPVAIGRICEILWEIDPKASLSSFYTNFSLLRRLTKIPKDRLFVKAGRCYLIADDVKVDTVEFEKTLNEALVREGEEKEKKLLEAKRIYRGHFLPSFLDEGWTIPYREGLREKYILLLEELVKYYFEKNHFTKLSDVLNEFLDEDEFNEIGYFYKLACYVKMGRLVQAKREYEKFSEMFRKELGVDLSFTFEDLIEWRTIPFYSQKRHSALVVEKDVFERYIQNTRNSLLIELELSSVDSAGVSDLAKIFRSGDILCFDKESGKLRVLISGISKDAREAIKEKIIERLKERFPDENLTFRWKYYD